MLLKLAAALLLVAGTALAAEPIAKLRGESMSSFRCRATWIPPARECLARCDATPSRASGEDARFECIQSCTFQGLQAIGSCRQAAAVTPPALASR